MKIDWARLWAQTEPIVWPVLRILAGVLWMCHGLQKVAGMFPMEGRPVPEVGSQIWVGGVIELVAGALIAVGLFTRAAAFIASGQMAVAYIQFHWRLKFDSRFFPIVNGGEDTVLYCFLFLYMVVKGAGRASIDAMMGKAA
jgi:putative oxidoreductase